MPYNSLVITLIETAIQMGATLATVLLARWMYGISSPYADIAWLEQKLDSYRIGTLKWYRGLEYLHQLRGKRLLA